MIRISSKYEKRISLLLNARLCAAIMVEVKGLLENKHRCKNERAGAG
jgi:hypothetical protein